MFLSHPLVEVLVGRGVEDIDALLQVPTWNDLPPILFRLRQWKKPRLVSLGLFGIANALPSTGTMTVMEILGAHILRSALTSLGVAPRTYLPHRDEGYGLSSPTVHRFSCTGTDLLITVDNGINARAAVRLALRLGIDVVVIDHHRIQNRAEATAVSGENFPRA